MIAPPADIHPGTDAYRRWYVATIEADPTAKAGIVAHYNAWKVQQGAPPVQTPAPEVVLPKADWPEWARLLADMAKPEDKGVGDVLHRLAGTAGELYIKLRKAIKWPCKCAQRRARLNHRYPLP